MNMQVQCCTVIAFLQAQLCCNYMNIHTWML
jgi:hypothetical protein